ncbi:hypothetical protein DXA95_07970 [Odoribacter sp. OF09-27XD]|nr:hypothetical protein DXA95_07970 [Odoribacter sp. OF09-27XD]
MKKNYQKAGILYITGIGKINFRGSENLKNLLSSGIPHSRINLKFTTEINFIFLVAEVIICKAFFNRKTTIL